MATRSGRTCVETMARKRFATKLAMKAERTCRLLRVVDFDAV
jgi:hypothetical protein